MGMFCQHQHPESTDKMIKVCWRGSEAVQFPLPAGIDRNNSHGWMTGRRGPTNQRLNSESVRIGQETDSQNRVSESLIPSASSPVPSMHPRNEGKSLSPAWLRDQYHSFTARRMPMAWHFPEAWCSILIEQWFSGPPCVYPLVLVRPSFLQTRWGLMILAKDSAQTTAQSVSISRRAVLAQLYAQLQPRYAWHSKMLFVFVSFCHLLVDLMLQDCDI